VDDDDAFHHEGSIGDEDGLSFASHLGLEAAVATERQPDRSGIHIVTHNTIVFDNDGVPVSRTQSDVLQIVTAEMFEQCGVTDVNRLGGKP
jgi:hypothetical protein